MRYFFPLVLAAGILMLGTVSCKEKKKSEDIIVARYVPEKPGAPIRLSPDYRRVDVKWLNAFYTVTTNRMAADSLPMLQDEIGQQYFDNRVVVTIQRSDSTVVFKKSFTKESFASYIDADFRGKGFLENVIFQNVEDGCLKFGVAVSRPGSEDEFVPLDLYVDSHNGLTIKPGKLFDSDSEDDESTSLK